MGWIPRQAGTSCEHDSICATVGAMPEEESELEPTPFDSVVGREEARLARGRPSGAVEAPAPAASGRAARVAPLAAAKPDFVAGVFAGIAATAGLVQLWLGFHVAPLREVYAALEGPPMLPTRVAISSAWHAISVLVVAGLVAGGYVASRGRRWPMIVVAVVALAIVAFTYLYAFEPIHALGGMIKAE